MIRPGAAASTGVPRIARMSVAIWIRPPLRASWYVSLSSDGAIPSTGTISGCPRKYAESDGSIGRMSSLTGAPPPGPPTTTGGTFLGPASLGARILTQVVAPITAQKSDAHTRETRATLAHRSQ